MTVPTILALITLVVGVPLNGYALVVLRRLYKVHPSPILNVLIIVWISLVLLALVFGGIFLFNDGYLPVLNMVLDADDTKLITRALINVVLISAPTALLVWRFKK